MLKYGDFIWPNDPDKLSVRYARKVGIEPAENGSWSVENLAYLGRVFEGEGAIYGDCAYETLAQLAQSVNVGTAQPLQHPKWPVAQCILTELEVTEERQKHALCYRFKFVEVPT